MKDGFIKVAAAAPQVKVADCFHNADEIIRLIHQAYTEGVKLLTLPELCITGYTCGDLFFQETLIRQAKKALDKIISETRLLDMVTVVGLPIAENGKLFNCAAVISKGALLGFVKKQNLPNYNEFYEKRHFESGSGDEILVFQCDSMPEFCFGVEICEDLWSVRPPSIALAENGALIIVNPSASNETVGKEAYRRSLVQGQSGRLVCGYVYASAGEGESTTDMVFAGHHIIAENGAVLSENRLFESKMVISEIDLHKLAHERRKNTTFPKEKANATIIPFSIQKTTTALTRKIESMPFVPQNQSDRAKRCETILNMQCHGLKKRIAHTNSKALVIGVSGGIDSCLALLVCVRALALLNRPASDILAVSMPCFGTTSRTKNNAKLLSETLGVSFLEIDITQSVRSHFQDIGHDENNHDVVYENVQARERTQVLMDLANAKSGMVIGTGDLSEFALGWATYNGDHMSMYGVNASVPKTLVRHIVKYVADTCENPALTKVLENILDTPVSPELLPAKNDVMMQITEDIVGPYELHDFFLYYIIRWGFPPKKVYRIALYAFQDRFTPDVILKWLKNFYTRFFTHQFKRSCMPDGAKIGSVSLSPRADWRMPSDAVAKVWLSELEQL